MVFDGQGADPIFKKRAFRAGNGSIAEIASEWTLTSSLARQ